MPPLQVLLFGGFSLLHDGEPLPPITSRVGRTLFAYLVVNRGLRHPRERLAALFWPDLPEARARRRLSHTLWQIQDVLGELGEDPGYLEATPETLAFSGEAPYWLDVDEFERRVERYRPTRSPSPLRRAADLVELEDAVDLYRGDFLSGFYDDWVLAEQERLSQLHLDALGWLVDLAKGQGAYEDALTYAKRLTHHDPLREDAHREVMRLSVLLGRASEALRQYERCRSVLLEELGTEPALATRQLHDKIARQRHAAMEQLPEPPESFPLDLPLVGRDRERSSVVESLEAALGGRGGAVLVEGDAGVGKTRLATEIAADAQWRGFAILHGTCAPTGAPRPYAALVDALAAELSPLRVEQLRHRVPDVLVEDAARLLPTLRRGERARAAVPQLRDAEASQRMREAVTRVVHALADVTPTLLVIEDVHAGDPETLAVLEGIAGDLTSRRLVLVLTYRGDEARDHAGAWDTIRALDRVARPKRVLLEPLTAFGTGELVRATLGGRGADAGLVNRLQRETGGNPLFVLETLRALRDQGHAIDGGEADQLPLASGIRDVVVSRVDGVPGEVRRVLEHAAVLGTGTDLDTLALASDRDPADVADALDDLLRRTLLVEIAGVFRFRHELVRRVVDGELDDGERRAIHGRVARALEHTQPDRVEELAHHFTAAGLVGPAIGYHRRAAEHAVALHAYASARTHYATAVALLDQTPTSVTARFDLLASYETVLGVLGDREEQEAVLARLAPLAGGDAARTVEVARRRAWLAAHTDRFGEAERCARDAVAGAEQLGDGAVLGGALAAFGTVLTWAGRPEEAVPVLERAAAAYGDAPIPEADARYALGTALRLLQRYEAAATQLETAGAMYAAHHDLRGEAQALGQLAAVRMETGDVGAARRAYEDAVERSRSVGFRYAEGVNLVNLANLRYVEGQVAAALGTYEEAAAAFAALGHRRGEAMVRVNLASVRHAVLGDDDRAEIDARAALAYFTELGDRRSAAHCLETLGQIAIRRGDLERAREHLEGGLRLSSETEDAWAIVALERAMAELALAGDDPDDAIALADRALETCAAAELHDAATSLLALRGVARLARGDVDGAVADSRAAASALDAGVERRHVLLLRCYRSLEAAGDPAARDVLERAKDELEALLADLEPVQRASALAAVPEHRAIAAAWEAAQPPRVRVRMAAVDAPIGRPLTAEELVEVTLTLELPSGGRGARPDDRRALLAQIVAEAAQQGGVPTIDDLATLLEVSPATVRRDLRALRDSGVSVETRGSRAG